MGGKWVAYKSIDGVNWLGGIPDGEHYEWDITLKYFPTWREAFDYAFKEASK